MYIKIQDDYLDYLKENADNRIPNYQYGSDRYKPFFIIAQLNSNIMYVANVTSPKLRHKTLKDSIDFKKIFSPSTGNFLGAININYMFPVLPEYVTHLSIDDIKNMTCYVKNDLDRLIETQSEVAKIDLIKSFNKIYKIKSYSPEDNPALAKRCIDFKHAETVMLEFKLKEQFQRDDIKVVRSNDYSFFSIITSKDEYLYSETILNNIYGFLNNITEKLEKENELSIENDVELSL